MEIYRQKNVATRVTFPIIDADGDTVTAAAALDSESTTWADGSNPGAFADLTNEATEIGTSGVYFLSLTAAEVNFDYIYIRIQTTTTGAKTQHILINTRFAPLVNASGEVAVSALAAGSVTAAVISTGAIDADALAADAVAEIADGVWDEDATGHQTLGTFGQAIGDPVADTNTIYKAVVTDAAGATVGVDVVAIQADTDNIQTRLPAALVGGRIDSSVGAMAADVVTAAAIANGAIDAATFAAGAIDAAAIAASAIDADALAPDAGTEIAAAVWDRDATLSQVQGTFGQAVGDPVLDTNTIFKAVVIDATGATIGVDLVAVQADTDDIQTRLPAALVVGRMDSSVGAMAAAVIGAAAFAVGAIDNAAFNVTETLVANPAAGGIVAASFGAGAIDAAALAPDAVDEIWDEAMVEPAQAIPAETPALRTVLAYLYTALRNAITVTSTTKTFSNDAGVVTFKKALSDDGTTYTEAEAVAGP